MNGKANEKKLHKTNNTKRKIMKFSLLLIPFLIIGIIIVLGNSRLAMKYLPKGDYIVSLNSPNNAYTLNAYRYSGGATVDWSLRVEVEDNLTNKKTNIYWKYHQYDVNMRWIDENTVEINNIRLNIYKNYYNN